MAAGSFNTHCSCGLPSENPKFTVTYDDRREYSNMDTGRLTSRPSRRPNFQTSSARARQPLFTIQRSQSPVSNRPSGSVAVRFQRRKAGILKTRLPSPVKPQFELPNPPQTRFKTIVSNRLIPMSEARRHSSLQPPPPRGSGSQASSTHHDPRPARCLNESCLAQNHFELCSPAQKDSVFKLREVSSADITSPLTGQHISSSCSLGQDDFSSGHGSRLHSEVADVVKKNLFKEVQDLREKLQASESEKRMQDTSMHHLLSEQWETMEELLKEKCVIVNKLRVTKSQSLGRRDEERLIELVEKQDHHETEIEEAENELRNISDEASNSQKKQNAQLKQEVCTSENTENELIHERKWTLLKNAVKQATNQYHSAAGIASDLGAEILEMFQLRNKFYEKYDRVKLVLKLQLRRVIEKPSKSSLLKSRQERDSRVDFFESRTSVIRGKLEEDIVELQKLVFSSNYLCDAQLDNTRMKPLIPNDPIPPHITDQHDQTRLYNAASRELVDKANVEDGNKVCSVCKELEKKNFGALKRIYDLHIRNHEIYREDEDQALRIALWRHKRSIETLNLLQNKIKLQNELEAISAECQQLDLICDKKVETILAVMQIIDKILQITGSYSLAKYNVFGTHRSLTYENIAEYLTILHDRICEILQLYAFHVKNVSSSQKSKEAQNIYYTDEGTTISSSSPQLETQNALPVTEPLIAGAHPSKDATKTLPGKPKKTLAEMHAEIESERKWSSDKSRIHFHTYSLY